MGRNGWCWARFIGIYVLRRSPARVDAAFRRGLCVFAACVSTGVVIDDNNVEQNSVFLFCMVIEDSAGWCISVGLYVRFGGSMSSCVDVDLCSVAGRV